MKHTFSIKKAIQFGWLRTKENWAIMLTIGVITTLISIFADSLTNIIGISLEGQRAGINQTWVFPDYSSLSVYTIFNILMFVITMWISFNTVKMILNLTDGHKENIKNLFNIDEIFWKYLLATIVYGLICVIGFIALIIPGIYFMAAFSAAPYLIFDKKLGLIEAFKKSYEITKGNILSLIGLTLFCLLIIVAGLILLIVGVIPAIMIVYFASFYAYRKMIDGHVKDEEKIA
jgi:uncharacterized membrane protein